MEQGEKLFVQRIHDIRSAKYVWDAVTNRTIYTHFMISKSVGGCLTVEQKQVKLSYGYDKYYYNKHGQAAAFLAM